MVEKGGTLSTKLIDDMYFVRVIAEKKRLFVEKRRIGRCRNFKKMSVGVIGGCEIFFILLIHVFGS
jgi:hypothetical protein